MTTTMSTQGEETLMHLVCTVLKQEEDGKVMKELKELGVEEATDLVGLLIDLLSSAVKIPGETKASKIKPVVATRIAKAAQWWAGQSSSDASTWMTLTPEILMSFLKSSECDWNSSTHSSPGSTSTSGHYTELSLFKKAIKPDVAAYKSLKTDKGWLGWVRAVTNTAQLHGTGNVLDPDYSPLPTPPPI